MQRREEASGRLKALLSLAFLAAIIFVAIKIIPAYVNNFQLQDHIRQVSTQLAARTRPVTPDEIGNEVISFARDHGIPIAADNVNVTISPHISINVDYTVPVDLIVYNFSLHFTPSAVSPTL
jgi:cell division protein FtsL